MLSAGLDLAFRPYFVEYYLNFAPKDFTMVFKVHCQLKELTKLAVAAIITSMLEQKTMLELNNTSFTATSFNVPNPYA